VGYMAQQSFELDGKSYDLAMRFTRHYKPFNLTLLEATHKKYRGTEVPKDFRSRVRVQRADTGELRETEIYMNAPLRFAGYTFFQFQMSADPALLRPGQKPSSTFQVMQNPSWLTPYISCGLVGFGLVVQFMMHLVGFFLKRRPA
jgi:cytochrome c biogenesis protein ResB